MYVCVGVHMGNTSFLSFELRRGSTEQGGGIVSKDIEVGKVRVKAGEKKSGFLRIGELAPAVPINLPFMIVNGVREGPKLCLIAGEHTSEMSGIVAIIRILQESNVKELSGSLITVPCVNILALPYYPDRYCPIDQKNVNRFYPGDSKGSVSDRLCDILFNEVILKSDYLIDFHDVGVLGHLAPYATFHRTGKKKVDAVSESLARNCGSRIVVVTKDPYDKGMSIAEASEKGIPAVLFESANGRDVDTQYKAIANVMKHLGMIKGKPEILANQRIFQGGFQWLSPNHGGIVYPALEKVGKMVSKGEVLAEIRDIFGEPIEEVRAPEKSMLLHIMWGGIVNTGTTIGEVIFEYPSKEVDTARALI
jgi:predicted deacylase